MPISGVKKQQANREAYRRRKAQRATQGAKKVLVQVRVLEALTGRIQDHMDDRRTGKTGFPWKSRNDAYNGLLAKGLEKIAEEMPDLEIDLAFVKLLHQVSLHRTQQQEALALLATTRDSVMDYLAKGAEREAGQLFHTVMASVQEMPKTFWNEDLQRELVKAFPALAREEAKGVRLVNTKKGKNRERVHGGHDDTSE